MTFDEAKREIAIKHKLGTKLVTGHKANYFEEAAELYADIKVKEVSSKVHVSGQLPSGMFIHHEYSFGKHCYKYQPKGDKIIVVAHPDQSTALRIIMDKVKEKELGNLR